MKLAIILICWAIAAIGWSLAVDLVPAPQAVRFLLGFQFGYLTTLACIAWYDRWTS